MIVSLYLAGSSSLEEELIFWANFERPVQLRLSSDFDAVCCVGLVSMSTSRWYGQNLSLIASKNSVVEKCEPYRNFRHTLVAFLLLGLVGLDSMRRYKSCGMFMWISTSRDTSSMPCY